MFRKTAGAARLTDVERRLVDHVRRGKLLNLTVRAGVPDILRGRLAPNPDPHGLRLWGARIAGRLDLMRVTTNVGVELYDCLLDEGVDARYATLPALVLGGCRLEHPSRPPLDADELTVTELVLNQAVITADCKTGAVRLPGAHLGGQLRCMGATIRNNSGPALVADGLQNDQDVFLREGFQAIGTGDDGAVRLSSAHLGGLECTDATISNDSGPALVAIGLQVDQDVYLSDGFEAVGGGSGVTLDLREMRIGGELTFAPKRLEHTAGPQAWLALDGLTYVGLPKGTNWRDWLRLLREATPSYAAQPYQHLAAAYRAAGHDDKVRRILMAQRQDQIDRKDQIDRRELIGGAERVWAWLTKVTLGYGYQPWRALLFLIAVAATAVVLALTLGAHGGLARINPQPPTATKCSAVERVAVGLDLGLPLVRTGIRAHCDTTASATGQALSVAGWGLQLLAWAFATLFVAGFTGAVRKT